MNNTLHYLLMADHSMFQRSVVTRLKGTGLTPGQPKVLDYLLEHDGSMQKEIAAACHIEAASLSSILNGMEIHNLIRRETRNGNRRSLYVYLTETGRQYALKLEGCFSDMERTAMKGLNQEERDRLIGYLTKVYDNLVQSEQNRAVQNNEEQEQ